MGARRWKRYFVIAVFQTRRIVHDPFLKIVANTTPIHSFRNGLKLQCDGKSTINDI